MTEKAGCFPRPCVSLITAWATTNAPNTHSQLQSRLGPRFYDWQLVQSPEESWRECHLHARNLLGADGYRRLLDETVVERQQDEVAQQPQLKSNRQLLQAADSQGEYILNDSARVSQGTLFE